MSDDTLNNSPDPLLSDTALTDIAVEEICDSSDEGFVIETEEIVIIEEKPEVIDDLNQSMEDYVENYQQSWQKTWQESIEAFELDVMNWQDTITRFELDVTQWQDHAATFKAIEQNAMNEVQNRVPEAAAAKHKVASAPPFAPTPASVKKVKTKSKTSRT